MKFKINFMIFISVTTLFFAGCSNNVIEEYNKPAVYWYGKIVDSISNGDLEEADSYYSSLQGEHIGSPLLPEATLILSIAHMHYEEYLLSEHFSNEYIKRYATVNEKEFAEFMKIKAKYMALPNPRRDQVLIKEAINEGEVFKITYPRSMYFPIVDTMLTNLRMAEAVLNESIADLYLRLDKPRSAEYYRNIKPQAWINWDEIERANTSWYRAWFEGDGTESWYGFMIPDTQSVVSRNTVQEEYIPAPVDKTLKVQQNKFKEDQKKQVSELAKVEELNDSGALDRRGYEALRKEILGTDYRSYYNQSTYTPRASTKYISKIKQSQLRRARDLMNEGVLSKAEFLDLEKEILGN